MNNQFLTLRAFASESLGLPMKPNQSDIEMSMHLGENYSRVFAKKINEAFDIKKFDCRDNGIVRSIHCITENGYVEVRLSKNVLSNSNVMQSVIKENNEIFTESVDWTLFNEFQEAVERTLRLIEEKNKCEKTV